MSLSSDNNLLVISTHDSSIDPGNEKTYLFTGLLDSNIVLEQAIPQNSYHHKITVDKQYLITTSSLEMVFVDCRPDESNSYFNETSGECLLCSNGCEACNDESECMECDSKYFMENGTCSCDPLLFYVFENNTCVCNSSGYFVDDNGTCVCDASKFFVFENDSCVCNSTENFVLENDSCVCDSSNSYVLENGQCVFCN